MANINIESHIYFSYEYLLVATNNEHKFFFLNHWFINSITG